MQSRIEGKLAVKIRRLMRRRILKQNDAMVDGEKAGNRKVAKED